MQLTFVFMTAATVTLAGIGGLYYAFACSVMPGLRATDDATFVSAMSRINSAIQNPLFALSFFGAFMFLTGALATSWMNGLASTLVVGLAWVCYTATLVITFRVNIPLNNRLGQAAGSGQTAAARESFERRWTRWNIYRAWLSLTALVALCAGWAALAQPCCPPATAEIEHRSVSCSVVQWQLKLPAGTGPGLSGFSRQNVYTFIGDSPRHTC